ncbi:MAG: HD domain-containing phosphohydrolase [Planctomycetaceae bacterium]
MSELERAVVRPAFGGSSGTVSHVETRLRSLIAQEDQAPSTIPIEPVSKTPENWLPVGVRTARVMIVDDDYQALIELRMALKSAGFDDFLTTSRPTEALPLLRSGRPDVVILDYDMPEASGLDILRAMRMDPALRTLPVIITSEHADHECVTASLEAGAHDHIVKSAGPTSISLRVRNAIQLRQEIVRTHRERHRLENVVKQRTQELLSSRQLLIVSLARAAEFRDNETGNHVVRVGNYAGIIAEQLGWSQEQVELIEQAAQLHDVGKIAIPDKILFKEGRLDPQEYELMKTHALLGRNIIEPYADQDLARLRSHAKVGSRILQACESPMMMMASRIAQTHHERWDGTGYPLGLQGTDIPIEGRITAVADVFDALSSARPYKAAYSRERCMSIIEKGRGTQFDPEVLDAFKSGREKIVQTQMDLADFVRPST